jgi:hypothetical protein
MSCPTATHGVTEAACAHYHQVNEDLGYYPREPRHPRPQGWGGPRARAVAAPPTGPKRSLLKSAWQPFKGDAARESDARQEERRAKEDERRVVKAEAAKVSVRGGCLAAAAASPFMPLWLLLLRVLLPMMLLLLC